MSKTVMLMMMMMIMVIEYGVASGMRFGGENIITEINGRGDSLRTPRYTLYPQKLALTLPTSGGRLLTKATKFSLV
jgi:hypothetical protein